MKTKIPFTISVVIVTYKRAKELNTCLNYILLQSYPCIEVIVIDNAHDKETADVAKKRKGEFQKHNISLIYRANDREDSLPGGRNMGVDIAKGELISFIDDDVTIDKDYHKELVAVFKKHPDAVAAQGYNQSTKEDYGEDKKKTLWVLLVDLYNKVFQQSTIFEKEGCRILPSLMVTYPYPDLDKTINCQWLAGAASITKKGVLKEIPFDENLKRFAWCIDHEHPYRMYKRYPKGLFLTPRAKWWHKPSPKGRLVQKELIYMMEIYELYTFYRIIDQTWKNTFLYAWRRAGNLIFRRILFNILTLGRGNLKVGFLKIYYSIGAALMVFSHREELKRGDLEFFNKTLE